MFLVKLGIIKDVFGVTNEEDLQKISNVLQVILCKIEQMVSILKFVC